jgi:hypothetical protein
MKGAPTKAHIFKLRQDQSSYMVLLIFETYQFPLNEALIPLYNYQNNFKRQFLSS